MEFRRITPDISSHRIAESKQFYGEFIGLRLAMDLGWILTYVSGSNPTAQINLLRTDQENIDNTHVAISIESSDVKTLYEKAQTQNLDIIYPLTIEPWGVKRFFVKDPYGVTVNIMCHTT